MVGGGRRFESTKGRVLIGNATFLESDVRSRRDRRAHQIPEKRLPDPYGQRASVSVILVTGGTGRLGTHAVRLLRARAHQVRVLSRRTGGDLRTGVGVREAAAGVELVLHAASDTHYRRGAGDPQQTRNLLAACENVRHVVYISIVGIDQIPLGYYAHKLECERLVSESGLPHTVLRATQFHELVDGLFTKLARWPLAPLPPRAKVQPVAAEEVARRCVELLEGKPLGRAPDFGGPEIRTVRELLDLWPGRMRLLPLPIVGRLLHALAEGRNTAPGHADGRLTWAQYLARQ
jgi:uncharacterized protein YbjT (DUF2867 family)